VPPTYWLAARARCCGRAGYEDLGFELVARDCRREGAALLDQSWDIYREVGATGPMMTLQDRMRKAGFRRGQWRSAGLRPESGWAALTQAETRVARLIGSGYNQQGRHARGGSG
jgi:hypothetical protein